MRVAIYSPYLDTAGGGEKYILTIAEALSLRNFQVDVLLDKHLVNLSLDEVKNRPEKLHNLNLSKVRFIAAPLGAGSNFIQRLFFLNKYDLVFYNSDGSFFYSSAKHNIVHFQIPLRKINTQGIWNYLKLKSWDLTIYNSQFTKEIIEKNLHLPGLVIYPPVDVNHFNSKSKKKNQILSVGRISGTGVKKQHVMIEAFKKWWEVEKNDWSLHLVGGMMDGDKKYFSELKVRAKGLPIWFYPNLGFDELTWLYQQSSIYWHAMGNDEVDPIKMEHFGISTVEAMAAGCVPIVINKGGQKEIIESNISGILWNNIEELLEGTNRVIKDPKLMKQMSIAAYNRSRVFSKELFIDKIVTISNAH